MWLQRTEGAPRSRFAERAESAGKSNASPGRRASEHNTASIEIIRELPADMIVFSSDFPHFEGFTDPIGHYGVALADLSPERRERFFGGAIAEVYARMGDPIAASAP